MPLIQQLVQSEVVLTDETRADIQLQVMRALRKLGFKGEDL